MFSEKPKLQKDITACLPWVYASKIYTRLGNSIIPRFHIHAVKLWNPIRKTHSKWRQCFPRGKKVERQCRRGEGTPSPSVLRLLSALILNTWSNNINSRWRPHGCLSHHLLSFLVFSFMFSKQNKTEHWSCSVGPEVAPSLPSPGPQGQLQPAYPSPLNPEICLQNPPSTGPSPLVTERHKL